MTIAISPATRSYDPDDEQIEVGACTECLTLCEADDLRDCGTHTMCPDCLSSSPCSSCKAIRHEEAADMADDRAYDAWADSQEDYR